MSERTSASSASAIRGDADNNQETIWLQTGTGRAFDLLSAQAAHVDFDVDIPEALARLPRYTGHVRSGPYSVAQHCVIGADAVYRDTRDATLAACFLLHDAHEAYLGDIATPVAAALSVYVGDAMRQLGFSDHDFKAIGRDAARVGLAQFKAELDYAILSAAGLPCPLPARAHALIKTYDLRLLVTERAHLLGKSPRRWHDSVEMAEPLRLRGKLTVWSWPKAADEYRARIARYLPHLASRGRALAPPLAPIDQPASSASPRRCGTIKGES